MPSTDPARDIRQALMVAKRGPAQARDADGKWATSAQAGGGREYEPVFGKKKKNNVAEAIKAAETMGYKAHEWKPSSPSLSAAVFSNGALHINANHKFWSDPVEKMKFNHASGQLSSDSPAHVIHHEIGHVMYDPPDNFFHMAHRDLAKDNVSKYAGVNPKELVSEVHAGMMGGKKYSPEVMNVFGMYAKKRQGA